MMIETTVKYTREWNDRLWTLSDTIQTPITDEEHRRNKWPRLVNDDLAAHQEKMGAQRVGVEQMLLWRDDGFHTDIEVKYLNWLIEECRETSEP